MQAAYGGHNMVDPLRRVLVRRPDEAFAVDDPERWHYTSSPDLDAARSEHDALVEILQDAGAEVIYHDVAQPDRADSIYVFDPALITDRGVVVLSMGKTVRRGEEDVLAGRLEVAGVPRWFGLTGEARAEGGDLMWLDRETLVAGRGFRTNAAGIEQLRSGLAEIGVTVFAVDLPYFTGPAACLHLMTMISPLDHDLAVVYPPLLPVPLWELLKERGVEMVEVPESEFATMGPNILALAPRRCLMLEGNPVTHRRLEAAGCEIMTYRGTEISLKAEGGPTCLTRPILRAP
ncbi:MAG: arginine deiminase family protein [Acidobacteriota bacterium]